MQLASTEETLMIFSSISKEAESKWRIYLVISWNTVWRQEGFFPFLWNFCFSFRTSIKTSPDVLDSSKISSDQNFSFWSQDFGLRVFSRNGENITVIFMSSCQSSGRWIASFVGVWHGNDVDAIFAFPSCWFWKSENRIITENCSQPMWLWSGAVQKYFVHFLTTTQQKYTEQDWDSSP